MLIAGVASNAVRCSESVSSRSGWNSSGNVGATGGRGVEGRDGVAGMIIDAASMGLIGLGARIVGDIGAGAGNVGAGGSAMVVAVAASRTLNTFSAGSWCGSSS